MKAFRLSSLVGVLILFVGGGGLKAQEPAPHMTIVQAGADDLLRDLEFLLRLTSRTEQAQWEETIKPNLEIFLEGVDRTRPIRIDAMLSDEAVRYRSFFPITDVKDFLNNLDSFGIISKRVAGVRDYYRLEMPPQFTGFMRVAHNYAIIVEQEADAPANIGDPTAGIANLLGRGYGAAVVIDNEPGTVEPRQREFTSYREETLAGLKPIQGETEQEFTLRRMAADHQLQEMERYFVQSDQLVFGWTTDRKGPVGRGELFVTPLEGTSLQKSIQLIGEQPSHFAAVSRARDAVLYGRIRLPLEEMRQRNLAEMYTELQPYLKQRVETRWQLAADQQENANKAIDILFEMLNAGREAGLLDGYVQIRGPEQGAHSMVAGVKTPDGNRVLEILELLPEISSEFQIELNVEEIGGTAIHSVSRPQELQTDFFGPDAEIYVGTDAETVWIAVGNGVLADLKEAITATTEPAGDNVDPAFARLYVRFSPWLQVLEGIRADQQAPTGERERQLWQEREALRKLALESFDGPGDSMEAQLQKVDNRLVGTAAFGTDTLRFVGKVMAKFARENLQ